MASVDREIALLKQVRALLSGASVAEPKKKAGARKLVAPAAVAAIGATAETTPKKRTKKRKLSPEGRKRIAEAVKRRWEAQRKSTSASK